MQKSWRPLVMAVAVSMVAGVASAQSVMIRKAPAGGKVEVALNSTVVATGTANADGDATLPLDLSTISKTEIDANVHVDVCDKTRRVVIVEKGRAALLLPDGCDRRDVAGLFWVRTVNTIVVDVSAAPPSLLLIRGSYTPPKPVELNDAGEEKTHNWRPSPTGLALGGGGSLNNYFNAVDDACGNASTCSGNNPSISGGVSGTYWIKRFVGIDPSRFYGLGGANYHTVTSATSETLDSATQTFQTKIKGFGYLVGGGTEVWVTPKYGVYAEVGIARIKGNDQNGGPGVIDDTVRYILIGARVHLGPKVSAGS